MNIPNLRNMHPSDRAEMQQWCMEVVREFNALNAGRYQSVPGKQIIDARDATVSSGLTTKRQLDSAVNGLSTDIDDIVSAAVNKLKQDNNLV